MAWCRWCGMACGTSGTDAEWAGWAQGREKKTQVVPTWASGSRVSKGRPVHREALATAVTTETVSIAGCGEGVCRKRAVLKRDGGGCRCCCGWERRGGVCGPGSWHRIGGTLEASPRYRRARLLR